MESFRLVSRGTEEAHIAFPIAELQPRRLTAYLPSQDPHPKINPKELSRRTGSKQPLHCWVLTATTTAGSWQAKLPRKLNGKQ